jgi:hypothetical protein
VDEVEVRREAWYARLGAWKAAEGEGGAEMVGDEVSMSRRRGCCVGPVDGVLGLRLERKSPAGSAPQCHSVCRREGAKQVKRDSFCRGKGSP